MLDHFTFISEHLDQAQRYMELMQDKRDNEVMPFLPKGEMRDEVRGDVSGSEH